MESTSLKIKIKTYHPSGDKVGELLEQKGLFSFYESIENRKECCYIRKIEPLQKALKGKKVWVTGLRAEQSANRDNLDPIQWGNGFDIIKYNPIHDWTLDDVKQHIKKIMCHTTYYTTVVLLV